MFTSVESQMVNQLYVLDREAYRLGFLLQVGAEDKGR